MKIKPESLISGLAAGGLATLCMSALMMASKKLGIQGEHPPKRIVQGVANLIRKPAPRGEKLQTWAGVAHFAFGMAAGSAFSIFHKRFRFKYPALTAIPYGLGIWFLSYKGWVPKLGTMPPPEKDRPGRVGTMIAAHILFGAVLGCTIRRLEAD